MSRMRFTVVLGYSKFLQRLFGEANERAVNDGGSIRFVFVIFLCLSSFRFEVRLENELQSRN